MASGQDSGPGKSGSPLSVVKTVLAAFLGIRRRAGHESEAVKLTPVQIIVTGVIAAAVFVIGLILLVRFILSRAV